MKETKLFNLFGRLTKNPLEIKIGKDSIEYQRADKIHISPLFFKNDKCMQCGKCCTWGHDLYWSENEYYDLPEELKNKLRPLFIQVNEKEKYLWIYHNDFKTGNCDFLDENNLCKFHNYKALQGAFPPIEIDKRLNNVIILKRLVKRNHKFGCKMKLNEFSKEKLKIDIQKFKRLNEMVDYLKVDTFLPEIINKLIEISNKNEIPKQNTIIWQKK
jgi:hypothetical protein